ncbi:MAG: hypothetical protein DRJ03_05115 [Chloroflexi bacterium]|nr:MAG: hypothetical protein DRI81_00545 [Chloroflexota bacterium]RLC87727.1 MAG: hypothetical protein DRJ03_05115 [Chloroflexota bacterium]
MSRNIFVVTVPQLGVNDQVATIVDWYVRDEDAVSSGDPLCTLETTKAVFDVEADASGYVVCLASVGSEVEISQPIALIGSVLEDLRAEKEGFERRSTEESNVRSTSLSESVKATRKARATAQRLGVDLKEISVHGIIREQDVVQYVGESKSTEQQLDLSWQSSRQPVVIYGAGRGAITLKECLDFDGSYQVVCFVDDDPQHPAELCNLPVYHSSQLKEIVGRGVRSLACEIAGGSVRLRILRQCKDMGVRMITVIHPQAYVAPTVQIGKGNYIKAGAIVETNTVIGNCCIIDNGAVIAHDNTIADGCHIAPGVAMGSTIHVGELSIIGIGASIATGIWIGKGAIISVGSSVVKNVPDFAVVEGVPGRIVGRRRSEVKISREVGNL